MSALPRVAVFDIDLPPGLSVIRSLGRRGVPVIAYTHDRTAAGRYSRYVAEHRRSPWVFDTDRFVEWLADEARAQRFDLVALTSDYVAFAVAELEGELRPLDGGHPDAAAICRCLHKPKFHAAITASGVDVPRTTEARTIDEAAEFADRVGYPVVLKPRTHIGIGAARGAYLANRAQMLSDYECFRIDHTASQKRALQFDPDLALPLVQEYLGLPTSAGEVVSVCGVLGLDGEPLAIGTSRKIGRWPGRLGVGVAFEPVAGEWFVDAAVSAVQQVLGRGIFELELLVDRDAERIWAIDLNPRAFGQIELDVALGRDLPALWYESVTGVTLPGVARRTTPSYWQQGVPTWAAIARRTLLGPSRIASIASFARRWRQPHVGAAAQLSDPLPGVLFAARMLRNPSTLFRSVGEDA